jgi:hypothetical protein
MNPRPMKLYLSKVVVQCTCYKLCIGPLALDVDIPYVLWGEERELSSMRVPLIHPTLELD